MGESRRSSKRRNSSKRASVIFVVRVTVVDEAGEEKCCVVVQPRNKVWELQRKLAETLGVAPLRQKLLHRNKELDPTLFVQDALQDPDGHEVDAATITLVVNESGTFVLTGSVDRTAILWSVDTGQPLRQYKGHLNSVNTAVFSRCGSLVLTASDDHTARLWGCLSGEHLGTYKGHKWAVNSAAFLPENVKDKKRKHVESVVTASQDGTMKIFNMRSEECLKTFQGHTAPVNTAVYNFKGTAVLSASHDATAKLWSVETCACTHTFVGHKDIVFGAVYSADCTQVLTYSCDRTAALWSVQTGHCLKTFQNHRGCVLGAVFSLDQAAVLTVCEDHLTCRIHNIKSGECSVPFKGDGSFAQSADYGHDGRTVLLAYANRTAQIWNLETGERIQTLRGHGGTLVTAVFSPFEIEVEVNDAPMWKVGQVMEARFAGEGPYQRAVIAGLSSINEDVTVEWEYRTVPKADARLIKAPGEPEDEPEDADAEREDLYEVLGVDKSAYEEEIKKVYKQLSVKFSPDRNPTPIAAEKLARINDAFKILGDPDERIKYDREQEEAEERKIVKFEVGTTVEAKFSLSKSEKYHRVRVVAVSDALGTITVNWEFNVVHASGCRKALSIGNPVVNRPGVDLDTDVQFLDTGVSFQAVGRITSVKFFVAQAMQAGFKFQVYRHEKGIVYNLIWESPLIECPVAGVDQVYTLASPFEIQAGDCMGWVHDGKGTLGYTAGGGDVRWRDGIQEEWENVEFDKFQQRTYSYEVRWEKIPEPEEADTSETAAPVDETAAAPVDAATAAVLTSEAVASFLDDGPADGGV